MDELYYELKYVKYTNDIDTSNICDVEISSQTMQLIIIIITIIMVCTYIFLYNQ